MGETRPGSNPTLLSTPVSQDVGSDSVRSWVPATESLLPLLSPAQKEGAPRQDPQPTHLQASQHRAAVSPWERVSSTSHSLARVLRILGGGGAAEAPLVCIQHPEWSCPGGRPRLLQAGQFPCELSGGLENWQVSRHWKWALSLVLSPGPLGTPPPQPEHHLRFLVSKMVSSSLSRMAISVGSSVLARRP